jgi:tetratricopeptide (TPR) repeat protein
MPPADNNTPKGGTQPRDKDTPTGLDRSVSFRRGTIVPVRYETAPVRKPARPIDVSGLTAADADRLFWKGYRLFWLSRHEEALVLFNATVDLFGEDARYWYFKSLSESALGEHIDAYRSLRRAVDLHLEGKPHAELIGRALERVQGESRMKLRQALDYRKASR